ncbi:hypothetical protein EYF80_035657 [Liparis tanakae]|uniref:Uncharacterized protein n=1 Tax=Liparis tanakae TaxID=230148 RepID=A0A4Z2GLD0_9TELE|nr:hypothetical protein EYF80_035657 [Liparis tanakae]
MATNFHSSAAWKEKNDKIEDEASEEGEEHAGDDDVDDEVQREPQHEEVVGDVQTLALCIAHLFKCAMRYFRVSLWDGGSKARASRKASSFFSGYACFPEQAMAYLCWQTEHHSARTGPEAQLFQGRIHLVGNRGARGEQMQRDCSSAL